MKKSIWWLVVGATAVSASSVHLHQQNTDMSVPVKSWIEIKNQGLVRQHEDYSCGSASLATILKYYYGRKSVTEKKILDEYFKLKGVTRKSAYKLIQTQTGLSFLDLGALAQKWGYKPIGLGVDIKTLRDVQMPVIIYLITKNGGHFSVYKGIKNNRVYLADPSFGNTKMRMSKFTKMFLDPQTKQGKILAIIPPGDPEINQAFMKLPKAARTVYRMIGADLGK